MLFVELVFLLKPIKVRPRWFEGARSLRYVCSQLSAHQKLGWA
jgi:hypothetical protein